MEALDAYTGAKAIFERLASIDPENTNYQRDLAATMDRVADLRSAQDPASALEAYTRCLAISERLANADPDNVLYQRDLAFSAIKVASSLEALGDASAQGYWWKAHEILLALDADGNLLEKHRKIFDLVGFKANWQTRPFWRLLDRLLPRSKKTLNFGEYRHRHSADDAGNLPRVGTHVSVGKQAFVRTASRRGERSPVMARAFLDLWMSSSASSPDKGTGQTGKAEFSIRRIGVPAASAFGVRLTSNDTAYLPRLAPGPVRHPGKALLERDRRGR
jgi:tetratricopeptide (TPR) repeat protein